MVEIFIFLKSGSCTLSYEYSDHFKVHMISFECNSYNSIGVISISFPRDSRSFAILWISRVFHLFFSVDLVSGLNIGQLNHDSKIDWLEVRGNCFLDDRIFSSSIKSTPDHTTLMTL